MISFKQYLFEERARVLQHQSAYELLKKYKDDPDIYISMTNVNKIGLNPQSSYNTPLGIYTYPLKDHWKNFRKDDMTLELPFHGTSPYIWIVKKQCRKFVDDLYNDYTSLDYDRDMAIIRKEYGNHKVFAHNKSEMKVLKAKIDFAAKKVEEYESGTFKDKPSDLYYDSKIKEYKDLGYLTGDLEGVSDEKLKQSALADWVQTQLYYYDDSFKRLNKMYKEQKEPLLAVIDFATKSSKDQNAVSAFWNVTRVIASKIANGNPVDTKYTVIDYNRDRDVNEGNRGALEWNKLLRKLGYCGFADKSSKGIIHPAEPMQAVFLSKNAFKVLEKIDNVPALEKITSTEEMTRNLFRFKVYLNGGLLNYSMTGRNAKHYRKIADKKFMNPKWITEDIMMDVLSQSLSYFSHYNQQDKNSHVIHNIFEKIIRKMQYSSYLVEIIINNLFKENFNKKFIPYFNYAKKYHKKAIYEKAITEYNYIQVARNYDTKQKNYAIIMKLLDKGIYSNVSNRDMAKLDYSVTVWNKIFSSLLSLAGNLENPKLNKKYTKFVKYLIKYQKFASIYDKNVLKSTILIYYTQGLQNRKQK